jgi:hypothetical protein
MKKFGYFLLNEEKSYLGHKVGNVLTSLQDLQSDMENLGSRQLTRFGEDVVNQIRKILHSRWNQKHQNKLKELQKIAVAIQKTIDDRGDLREVLPAAASALERLSGKLGVKVNNLEAPEMPEAGGEDLSPQDFQATGPMPDFKNDGQDPAMPPQDPAMPPQSPEEQMPGQQM